VLESKALFGDDDGDDDDDNDHDRRFLTSVI